ncbi:MAG: hypothetical protein HY791_36855 [Deltaproteobacteria bacterium]|nr:hypothetical protein [Deltaproteobacteria bacterium]
MTLLLLVPSASSAGPWTKSLGEAYLKLSGSLFTSDTYVDPTGFVQAGLDHASLTTSLYAEVGVWDQLAVNFYLPHVVGRNRSAGGDRYASLGLGDASLGLQWSSPFLGFPHAIRAGAKFPLYDLGAIEGFEASRFPARGDGQVDFTVAISAGDGFEVLGLSGFGYLEAGNVFRSEWFTGTDDGRVLLDSVTGSGQVGLSLVEWLTLAVSVQALLPYSEDRVSKAYLTVGGAAFVRVWKSLSVELGADFIALARNGSIGSSYSLGVSYAL